MPAIKVLLVDDDPSYHQLTTRMLARADQLFDVDWVGTYEEGLAQMRQQQHDVYLLDYNLGHTSGLDLLREAKQFGLSKPVIMMTGNAQGLKGLDVQAIQTGATDYIDKVELRPAALQRSIRYALERSQSDRKLRESEELYRSLIEEAFDGIFITDADGVIELANAKICELVGTTEADLIGQNVNVFILPLSGRPALTDVGDGGISAYHLKREGEANDGVEVEVSAKRTSGGRLQFIVRDLAGRSAAIKERESYIERLNILRQVDDEMSQVFNLGYVLTMALDAATRLSAAENGFIAMEQEDGELRVQQAIGQFGVTAPDEYLPQMKLARYMNIDEEPHLIRDVKQEPGYVPVLPDTQARMVFPLITYEKPIGVMVLETRYGHHFTPENFDVVRLVSTRVAVAAEHAQLYKISQERYNELQKVYAQVSELEQIKTDMIRIAAHDIRNPVSVILGYVELMQMTPNELPGKFSTYIDMIERATRRLEKITSDILSLERIENIKEDEQATVDLAVSVREVAKEFKDQAILRGQTFVTDVANVAFPVRGVAGQLHEAIANLISNAIKYTPKGGNIQVELRQEGYFALFRVSDDGYGIPEEQQAGLFQPFFRARNETNKHIEGTGLGLHLIKRIVERFGGEILFESEFGKGSMFGFRLPIVRDTP